MQLFSLYHLFWLSLTALFVIGSFNMRRFDLNSVWHRVFRIGLFLIVGTNEIAWFLYRHFAFQLPLVDNLPLHLCDVSVFIMLFTLATGSKTLAELSYYMGAVGALLAVCFPAISETGSIRLIAEIRYFITHIALVGVGVYFTFGRHHYPQLSSILRSYVFIHLYALLVTPLNLLLDTNYFFTLAAPAQLGFIHHYPHWVFLAVTSLIFLCAFALLHIPFAWLHRQRDYSDHPSTE